MKKILKLGILAFCFCQFSFVSLAEIKLPAIFTDGMVLQQRSDDPVWGWASPGEEISVKGSWMKSETATTKADSEGKWMVKIKTPVAGGPYTLTIRGNETIVLNDVMIGEVWICSGQSNMEMPVSGWSGAPILHSAEEIKNAQYPNIRMFTVKRTVALQPQEDCTGSWAACTPETVGKFSATAYFFGRELYKKLKIPIGLIHSSWGGTVAEAWTSGNALRKLGDFNAGLDKLDSVRVAGSKASKSPNQPSVLYNGMIAPLIPYAMRGAIWYQGEANVGRAAQYEKLFPAMITDWRDRWKEGNFPFYFVQIAPYPYGGNLMKAAALRDAQRKTLDALSNTGMAVTMDIGNVKNIHPANKQEVGRRLSLWALDKVYGEKNIVYSGPLYKSMRIKRDRIILSFDYAKNGLMAKGGDLNSFEIAGADGNFVPAKATIDGSKIVLQADNISHPAAARYGWKDTSEPHLFNKSGLPASSFSTVK